MTWRRWLTPSLLLLVVACGSGAADHPRPLPTGETGGSAAVDDPAGSASGRGDSDGAADDGQAGASLGPAGAPGDSNEPGELGGAAGTDVQVVEVSAGEDVSLPVTPRVFLETTAEFYVFDRAGAIDERRFALDTSSLALVSFDPDGSAASEVSTELPVAADASGSGLVVLQLDQNDELVARTYDGRLENGGDEVRLTSASTGTYAVGASETQRVAVWSEDAALHGSLFDPRGVVGDGFDFGARSCGAHDCAARVVQAEGRFFVLWSRVDADGESTLSWGTIDEGGAALAARNVLRSVTPIRLEDVTALADQRLAVLLTLGSPAESPLLLFVDRFGAPEDTVHVYAGATAAWTLASDGTSLLMAARSNQSQGVVRQLELTGEPLSDWLVIDDSGIATAFEPRVALFNARDRYGAVVRMTDGSSATLELDPADFPTP